jgi:RNase_H superfamily
VRAQWDTIRPCKPLPPSAAVIGRRDAGLVFEMTIVAALAEAHPDAEVMPDRDPLEPPVAASREQATLAGLQQVAPLAGFCWEVDDPGGDLSMLRYAAAANGDQEARDWLATYNRNDTEATRALREWLDRHASDCPPIASVRYKPSRRETTGT